MSALDQLADKFKKNGRRIAASRLKEASAIIEDVAKAVKTDFPQLDEPGLIQASLTITGTLVK